MKYFIKLIYPWGFFTEKILFNHKISKFFKKRKLNVIATRYESKIYRKYNCIISSEAVLGKNLKFDHPLGIVIGTGVIIGDNVTIYQNVTLGRKSRLKNGYPIIENNVIIYANAIVVGDIVVAEGSIIGANSFVCHSTLPGNVIKK